MSSYPIPPVPLSKWLSHLQKIIQFFTDWTQEGTPVAFWLPGNIYIYNIYIYIYIVAFSFPQGLIRTIMQIHSRKMKASLDKAELRCNVRDDLKLEDLKVI